MTDEPTNTDLAAMFASDQLDSFAVTVANRIGMFHQRLKERGVSEEALASLTLTFGELAVGEHFGMDIRNTYGVGMVEED